MQKVGTYEVLETLYSGPRPLYKVKAADGRILALKTAPVSGLSPELRERFTREGQVCSTLDHPNLIRVYDAGEADGVLFQAMDLLEGGDLNRLFQSGRLLSWEEKLSIMEQVCDGLESAHGMGLIHRDIKPANIFLEKSGRIRLLDFGMARVDASNLTVAGSAVGTLNYMAPEQIRGETCTRAADIFSTGIVFYQLATERHPFSTKNSNIGMILNAILFDPPPPLSQVAPDAPEGLEFVLSKALEKDSSKRLPGAADLKQALSLCRITLRMRGAAASTPSGAVKTVPAGDEKTVAFRVPIIPPPPASVQPRPPGPASGAVPVVKAGPRSGAVQAVQLPESIFCSSCTFANPSTAAFCKRCGLPLLSQSGATPASPSSASNKLAIIMAISGGVLLVALMILIMMSRQ